MPPFSIKVFRTCRKTAKPRQAAVALVLRLKSTTVVADIEGRTYVAECNAA